MKKKSFNFYNLVVKCPKLKSSALGAFLLCEKDKCNDCNCRLKPWGKVDERIKKNSRKDGLWAFKFPVLGF